MPNMVRVKVKEAFDGFKKGDVIDFPEVLVKQDPGKFIVDPEEPVEKPKAKSK